MLQEPNTLNRCAKLYRSIYTYGGGGAAADLKHGFECVGAALVANQLVSLNTGYKL